MNYPLSNKYDPGFLRANMMGPNALKILEELSISLSLKPGMRVLDLGCGQGLTSIFLAKEFGVTVYAVDLWINATDNFRRFQSQGLDEHIIPLHLDAHELPFAEEYFDAAISVDAYHYFGAEEGFLEQHLSPHVRRGGSITIAVPGFQQEYGQNIPEALSQWIKPEFDFHSAGWWADLWDRSGVVRVQSSRDMDCYAEAWADWLRCDDNEYAVQDRDMIKADDGNFLSIIGMTAIKI